MKEKKIYLSYFLLFIYIILDTIVANTSLLRYKNLFITPILLVVLAVFLAFFLPKRQRRIHYRYEKVQNIIIILLIYSIIYFLSGLLFGYSHSIYQRDFLSLLKNLYMFLSVIILEEYIRNLLVSNSENNIIHNLLISLLLFFMMIDFRYLMNNSSSLSHTFQYISTEMLPLLVTSFLLTYLSRIAGKKATIGYRSGLAIMTVLLPILPNQPWIITAIFHLTLPTVTYLSETYLEELYNRRNRRDWLQVNRLSDYLWIIVIFICILFVGKCFRYFPISILSESMEPIFNKGDVVIVEKLHKEDLEKLKVYDIIYYKKNNRYIIHRIVEIKEGNHGKRYITKGDHNQKDDTWVVTEEEIIGKMVFSIPYLGYPSVWFQEWRKAL